MQKLERVVIQYIIVLIIQGLAGRMGSRRVSLWLACSCTLFVHYYFESAQNEDCEKKSLVKIKKSCEAPCFISGQI
jgi:hypothetical protein